MFLIRPDFVTDYIQERDKKITRRSLRTHWRLSAILKITKKLHEVIIFDIQKYVYSESVFNSLYIETKRKY